MFAEIFHRLVSKKLAAAMFASCLASALLVLSMAFGSEALSLAIVQFIGTPSFGALAYFVHAQGKVDSAEIAQ